MLDRSREFIELVLCLNFEKAAQHLNESVSTLSRHIADLERELGFILLERNPLRLTKAGQFYLEKISAIIGTLDEVISSGRNIAAAGTSDLRVWYLPSHPVQAIVQEAASRLESANPGTSVYFTIDDRRTTTEEALLEDKADVGILYSAEASQIPGLTCEEITRFPICIWTHRNNPVLAQAPQSLSAFKNCAIPRSIIRQTVDWTRSIIACCEASGFTPEQRLRTLYDRSSFYRSLRDDEFLIDFSLDDMPLLCNSELVKIIPEEGVIEAPVYACYRSDATDASLQFFLRGIRALAEHHGA